MTINVIVNKFLSDRKELIELGFVEDGKVFNCLIPSDCIWSVAKEILLIEEYEWLPKFELHNFKGKNIVDAGAHVGLFSVKASPYARKILAIEPHPMNYSLLKLNIRRNRILNIEPVNAALWHKKDTLFVSEGERSSRHYVSIDKKVESPSVNAITLRELLESLDVIHLLKLDIEGSEWELLLDARSEDMRKIEYIVGELHMKNKTRKDREKFRQKLEKEGYHVTFFQNAPYSLIKRVIKNSKRVRNHIKFRILGILSSFYRRNYLLENYVFFAKKV